MIASSVEIVMGSVGRRHLPAPFPNPKASLVLSKPVAHQPHNSSEGRLQTLPSSTDTIILTAMSLKGHESSYESMATSLKIIRETRQIPNAHSLDSPPLRTTQKTRATASIKLAATHLEKIKRASSPQATSPVSRSAWLRRHKLSRSLLQTFPHVALMRGKGSISDASVAARVGVCGPWS